MFSREPKIGYRGEPAGPSWKRLWVSFTRDETRLVEILMGLFFYALRGSFLVHFGAYNVPVELFLRDMGLSESRVGALCLVMAGAHLLAAATTYPGLRGTVATAGLALSLTVIGAFRNVEPHWHPVAWVWVTAAAFEFYILWRHFITGEERKRGSS